VGNEIEKKSSVERTDCQILKGGVSNEKQGVAVIFGFGISAGALICWLSQASPTTSPTASTAASTAASPTTSPTTMVSYKDDYLDCAL